jgi:hypothetical protein
VSVTVISALAPAIKASRAKPIAALRDVRSIARPCRSAHWSADRDGTGWFAAGVAGRTSAMQLLGLGALTTIMGVFVLSPVISRSSS